MVNKRWLIENIEKNGSIPFPVNLYKQRKKMILAEKLFAFNEDGKVIYERMKESFGKEK